MSAWETYLASLRQLDTIRSTHDEAARTAQRSRQDTNTAIDDLWRDLTDQRQALTLLADQCRLPPPPTHPPPMSPPDTADAGIAHARTMMSQSRAVYGEARYLAHRPKLFPKWRSDERNGLIYGVWALISLCVQVTILASSAGTGPFSAMIGVFAVCLALPFAAFGAGWLTIGVVSRPVLGEPIAGPDGRLERNPRLGLVICLSTLLVSCWLGNIYLT